MKVKQLCGHVRAGRIRSVRETVEQVQNLDETAEWFEQGLGGSTLFSGQKDSSAASMYLGPMTPLAVAASYGQIEAAEELLRKGANPNALSGRDKDYTPLDCVIQFCDDSKKEAMLSLLRRHGGKLNATERNSAAWTGIGVAGLKAVELGLGSLPDIAKSAASAMLRR